MTRILSHIRALCIIHAGTNLNQPPLGFQGSLITDNIVDYSICT